MLLKLKFTDCSFADIQLGQETKFEISFLLTKYANWGVTKFIKIRNGKRGARLGRNLKKSSALKILAGGGTPGFY